MIRINLGTWNERRDLRWIMKRIWWHGFWTPFIRKELKSKGIEL